MKTSMLRRIAVIDHSRDIFPLMVTER